MSLLFAAALAASSASLPVCSWDRPGRNVFSGDVPGAVDRYVDIPAPVRAALKKRMAAYQYDEVATIRRDSIEGKYRYSDLREMHFGAAELCRNVTRDKWAVGAEERGLVYCESGHCLIVPTVCRNVSRVTRGPAAAPAPPAPAQAAAAAGGPGQGAGPGGTAPATAAAAGDELSFDPPSAGAGPGQSFQGRAGSSLPLAGAAQPPSASPWFDLASVGPGLVGGGAPHGRGPMAFGPGGHRTAGVAGSLPQREPSGLVPDAMPDADPGLAWLAQPPMAFEHGLPAVTRPVPEPASGTMWVAGLALLAIARLRRKP